MVTDVQVAQAFSDLKATCGGLKEDYFGLVYLENEHGLPRDKSVNQVTFGGHDASTDIISISQGKRFTYSSLSSRKRQFKESMTRLINDGMNRIFDPNIDLEKNQIFVQIRSCRAVCFRFVFLGTPLKQRRDRDKLKEDLEAKRYLVEPLTLAKTLLNILEFRKSRGPICLHQTGKV